jgi:hypothetical protein
MPAGSKMARMEQHLKDSVQKYHPDWPEEKKDREIYGVMRKAGWKPPRERKKER